ncbi:MAG: hypothetical protein AAF583_05725 [Pseudomonadota bacterium]
MQFLKVVFFALIGSVVALGTFAQEETPDIPAELVNPDIPSEELAYELIPLTKEQLDPLARAWRTASIGLTIHRQRTQRPGTTASSKKLRQPKVCA